MESKSREIKFRVWDKQEQEMLYSDSELIKNFDIFSGWWFEEGKESVDRERMVLMQFIGLKDKRGNDIYEGDIITFYDDGSFYCVQYDGGNAEFNCGETHNNPLVKHNEDGFEIVGNLYENSNLLDEE